MTSTSDVEVNKLIINKLTSAQYSAAKSAGGISETELYLVTDETSYTQAEVNDKLALKQDKIGKVGDTDKPVYFDENSIATPIDINFNAACEYAVTDSVTGISSSSDDEHLATAKAVYAYIQSLDGNSIAY